MDSKEPRAQVFIPIAGVERDTGLSKDALRVWERRYGFPRPARDALGERSYSPEEVDKLRVIKRLMDLGHRPGKLVGHPLETLKQMAEAGAAASRAAIPAAQSGELDQYLQLVKAHRVEELRRQLSQALLKLGLARFVIDVVAELNERVGDAWASGAFEIFEEHLYTESIQVVLRSAINNVPRPGSRPPVVLLTTLPQEAHGLGLLMAECIFALDGCRCISLGVQTPVVDIVQAATSQSADIVGLSFSACINPNHALDGLEELRAKLPPATEIWAGGACPALHRRPPAAVHTVRYLSDIAPMMARWRAAHRA